MLTMNDEGWGPASQSTDGATVAVIVNYRTADATVVAVKALQASVIGPSAIIVVDNGSGDGSGSRIAAGVEGFHLIEVAENLGFAAGCNAGIRDALGRGAGRVLLLNADAVVSPSAIGEMERLLESDERLGIVGPVVVSKQPPGQIESYGIRYSRRTGRMWNLDFGNSLSSVVRSARRDVDAVSGCAMLVKRVVFERIGLFDEDYFFGFEDIDLCLRTRDVGFLSAVTGTATVEHEAHISIGRRSDQRVYFATRNHLLLADRRSGTRSLITRWFQTTSILGLNLANAVVSRDVSPLGGLRGFVRGARDHFSGRYGQAPSGNWRT
jgi:GT2 family glycosyltransferase